MPAAAQWNNLYVVEARGEDARFTPAAWLHADSPEAAQTAFEEAFAQGRGASPEEGRFRVRQGTDQDEPTTLPPLHRWAARDAEGREPQEPQG